MHAKSIAKTREEPKRILHQVLEWVLAKTADLEKRQTWPGMTRLQGK
jgi:hypothetical protein